MSDSQLLACILGSLIGISFVLGLLLGALKNIAREIRLLRQQQANQSQQTTFNSNRNRSK